MALGWLWWRAWVPFDAVVAAAVFVACVAFGDIGLHFMWQAWRLLTPHNSHAHFLTHNLLTHNLLTSSSLTRNSLIRTSSPQSAVHHLQRKNSLPFGLSFFCHLILSFFLVLSFVPVICLSLFFFLSFFIDVLHVLMILPCLCHFSMVFFDFLHFLICFL